MDAASEREKCSDEIAMMAREERLCVKAEAAAVAGAAARQVSVDSLIMSVPAPFVFLLNEYVNV